MEAYERTLMVVSIELSTWTRNAHRSRIHVEKYMPRQVVMKSSRAWHTSRPNVRMKRGSESNLLTQRGIAVRCARGQQTRSDEKSAACVGLESCEIVGLNSEFGAG